MNPAELIHGLPGEALIAEGLADWHLNRPTINACLVEMARPRLAALGLIDASRKPRVAEPELELYRLLRQAGGDSYSRYKALVGELVSFEQALDRRSRSLLSCSATERARHVGEKREAVAIVEPEIKRLDLS